MSEGLHISIVVPTYRRPRQLAMCLNALATQSPPPSEVIVVTRQYDAQAHSICSGRGVREIQVDEPGQLAALAAGCRAATGEVIAFLDDDAEPSNDWTSRVLAHFQDPQVGGVGGRDVIAGQDLPLTEKVGTVGRFGKLIGNHHLGCGPARDVDVLKGCSMAFRRAALAFPHGLRGAGAQAHNEVAICLWARRGGWRLVYDPAILVDHRPGPRFDNDRRSRPSPAATRDAAHNLVTCILACRPTLLPRRAAYGILLGDGGTPGIGRAAIALVRGEPDVLRRVLPSLTGQAQALARAAAGRKLAMTPIAAATQRPSLALVAHEVHDAGGMERAFAELVRRLHCEYRVVVVSRGLDPELRPLVEWRRVRVPRRPFTLKFVSFFVLGGLRLTHRRTDLVHTCGAIVPNRVDVASIHFCHAGFRAAGGTLAPREAPALRRLNTTIARLLALAAERWCYRSGRVGALAAVSPGVAAEVESGYPGIPVLVTPNGVDGGRFRPDAAEGSDVRRAYGAEAEALVALFVGGDWDRKGLAIAIEGLALARRATARPLRLWVVGRGDRERFEALARSFGSGDNVRFFGPRADAERFYRAADVLVLPTLYECAPLVAYEAAAAGLPIVATRVSGVVELVGEDEAGILVERHPRAVASALAVLAADPALRDRLGKAGRSRARAYTWERSVASVDEIYQALPALSAGKAA